MKINYFHFLWCPLRGGLPLFVNQLISNQRNSGNYKVSVVFGNLTGDMLREFQKNASKVYSLNLKSSNDLLAIIRFIKFFKEVKADIVEFHTTSIAIIFTLLYYKILRKKTTLIFHDHGVFFPDPEVYSFLRRKFYLLIGRITGFLVDYAFTNTVFCRNRLLQLGFRASRTFQIVDGVDLEQIRVDRSKYEIFEELGIKPDGKLIIGTISRLVPYKKIDRFIEICRILHSQISDKFYGIIIGAGESEDYLKRLINQHKLQEIVLMPGYKVNPYNYLQIFDIFIFCSQNEALGATIIEAFLMKKLVIVFNDGGGATELIQNGKNGFIVKDEFEVSRIIRDYRVNKSHFNEIINTAFENAQNLSVENYWQRAKDILC